VLHASEGDAVVGEGVRGSLGVVNGLD